MYSCFSSIPLTDRGERKCSHRDAGIIATDFHIESNFMKVPEIMAGESCILLTSAYHHCHVLQ